MNNKPQEQEELKDNPLEEIFSKMWVESSMDKETWRQKVAPHLRKIQELLETQKAEAMAELKEKIIKELEEMRKEKVDFGKNPDMSMSYNQMLIGFSQAISEAIEIIKKIK